MNLFVWEINVTGNKKISSEEIINSVKEIGLETGTLRKSHFVQDMEWYLLRKYPEIAALEINIQGSVANIVVNEIKEESKMVPDDDIPINIVASRYGVIRKMDVFDGQGKVKTGDAVLKGELLVSAVYEDRHEKLTLKHARAKIIAETDYNLKVEFPLEEKIIKKDRLYKTTYKIILLGKIFYIGNYENTRELPFENEEKDFSFFGIKLPIKLIITRYFSVKENTITYNFKQGRLKAYENLAMKEKEEMKDMEIVSRTTEEIVKNGKYIINASYIVLMDIAEEQPIESDIPWENTDDMS